MELWTALAAALVVVSVTPALGAPRPIPGPLAGHPGNVFLRGEEVTVAVPPADTAWRLVDYDGHEVATVPGRATQALFGRLPVGFYRLMCEGHDWVSLAVVEPLRKPTPLTSPICVDVAMAWFYREDRMDAVASLCAVAGVNRVRDRLAWGAMEPQRGRFVRENIYDHSAAAQSKAALQVLQVNHSSPSWANPNGKRFPLDLRDAYTFYREMARRWRGKVAAFEPWNEADIDGFGGHTGAEMAALQKASYLGLKAGNPDVTGCLNVFATHVRAQLDDLAENEAWPYFDTYNLHHYEPFAGYPRLYADHRSVSAGRPMWVTECAMPVRWSGDAERKELSDADLREQSERLVKVFAGSLHEGSAATYYFILGNYVEGQTQFGIIRADLTPRPAYLALAAAGRLLADARPLGRVEMGPSIHAYAFRAKPDGRSQTVLVTWADGAGATLDLPKPPFMLYDHLGRALQTAGPGPLPLTSAPLFVVLPPDWLAGQKVTPPPVAPRRLPGKPSPIVFQALWPEETKILNLSAHRIPGKGETTVKVYLYNFGDVAVRGSLRVEAPKGWNINFPGIVHVSPGERVELPMGIDPNGQATRMAERIVVRGDFGAAGKPILSFRVAPQANALSERTGTPLPGAGDPAAWKKMVSGDGPMTVTGTRGGILVDAAPGGPDRWVYPVLPVPPGKPIPARAAALACRLEVLEGDGLFRAIFDERGGSSYVADFAIQPKPGEAIETVALLDAAVHGTGWSADDPDGQLDLGQVVTLKVGCNTSSPKVRYRVTNLRWVTR